MRIASSRRRNGSSACRQTRRAGSVVGIIGIIANPASGKDVRRLVARASVFDNREKQAIVGRLLCGAATASEGACRVLYFDDSHGIARAAVKAAGSSLEAEPVASAGTMSALDTVRAAGRLREAGCDVVVTLGGDGTNRAVAAGWRNVPVIPISTGTNNVFPVLVEATVAGAAAGLIATARVPLEAVARQAKVVRVKIAGESDDLALIDAVLSTERFIGARALLAPECLRVALLTRADPAGVGMTALGGLMHPLADAADAGLLLELGTGGEQLNAPLAPGYYRRVDISRCETVRLGEAVTLRGPGVLAFDGERERVLKPDQPVQMSVERTGPWVVNVHETLQLAARRGAFRVPPHDLGDRRINGN